MKHLAILLLAATTSAPTFADPVALGGPPLFVVTEKKTNVTFTFTKSGVGAPYDDEYKLDALIGTTFDFKGQNMLVWAELNGSVGEQRMMQLLNKQGRLEGVLHCKLIQIGAGPIVPASSKFGVSGHGCTIKKINY